MSFVYFITSEPDEYVKIGWALHGPHQRLAQLQTGCPDPLRLMAYVPATRQEERLLHQTFAELHHRGEWFYNDHKLLDLIRYLSDGWPRETKTMASRQTFEDALWDVVITGYDYPTLPDPDAYRASGNGAYWRHIHGEATA